ncbi:hypothetical protein ACFXPW_29730 [Streptomyces goshikiensis]
MHGRLPGRDRAVRRTVVQTLDELLPEAEFDKSEGAEKGKAIKDIVDADE